MRDFFLEGCGGGSEGGGGGQGYGVTLVCFFRVCGSVGGGGMVEGEVLCGIEWMWFYDVELLL